MEHAATLTLPLPAALTGPDALDRLLAHAPSSDAHFADALNAAVRELSVYDVAGAASLGQRLLALLDSGRLRGLCGSDGTACEVRVAARVLELGYPWALHLTPAQLQAVRELPDARRPRPRDGAFFASAVATGLLTLPVFASWLDGLGTSSVTFGGLYRLVSLGVTAANVLFALGRLGRGKTAVVATGGLATSWLFFELTRWGDAALWLWLGVACGAVLAAARLPGTLTERDV